MSKFDFRVYYLSLSFLFIQLVIRISQVFSHNLFYLGRFFVILMTSLEEEIEEVKQEIRETPYNKSTEKHIGRLKAKLARLKEEKIEKESSEGGGEGYAVEKSGDGTVILVGFPSVGKSTLLNNLTGAESEVADYEFTTLEVIPGSLKYKGANIQILDVPGIISGASEGKGRGREVISVLRNADLLLLMIDCMELGQYNRTKEEIRDAGIRLDEKPPDVKIQKKDSGGLKISATVDLDLSEEEVRSILNEYGIINADVIIRENLDQERLIDAVMENRKYVSGLVVMNKIDLVDEKYFTELRNFAEENIEEEVLFVSAEKGDLEELKEKIFEKLEFMRIYLKPQGEEPDKDEPMILKKGSDIEDLAKKIHRDLSRKFKHARVWGESAKHPSQQVGKDHQLADEDIVTIVS